MDGPLKVAIFSDSSLPVLNGVSISIESLINELRNKGHSVHLFTAHHPKANRSEPNTYRFRALETPWTKGYPLAFPPFYRMLLKFRRHDFDVIHTHTPFTVGFVGLRWAESHNIPIVSTYHTLYDRYVHYIPYFPRRYLRFKLAKHTNFYYNRVDHVITPSEAAQKWLRRHSVTTKTTVIPTDAMPRRFFDRAEIRLNLGIPPDHKVLLYVGRLAKEKNMSTLFDMAKIALNQDASLRLWLVGDGPYRTECVRIVRELGIGDRVRFVGFVPRAEVDAYYAAADLFVFPSITETQGLVVQEAMVYGLPAVAISGGGASESIQDGVNGFVVKNDAETFAAQVLEVVRSESLLRELSDGASRSTRSANTPSMCDQVVAVYREAIADHRGLIHHTELIHV
ncbi:MAG TPA: glycosyltransferase family 4 protein [Fimbriimonadaceae bacterium]|nr:glycosyltransferase family 4 protein [Fimbriimonadaceae bacterium]